jgi:hypothetical protein
VARDFYSSLEKNPVPNFKKERDFVMEMMDEFVPNLAFHKMVQFLAIDKAKNSDLKLEGSIIIKLSRIGEYEFYLGDSLLAAVSDHVEIEYIIETDYDKILQKSYDIDSLI